MHQLPNVDQKWPKDDKKGARNGRLKRAVILTRGLLGGCATQACAVKDRRGKTPLQWAEENKAPEEVLSLLRAVSAIDLDQPGGWQQLAADLPQIAQEVRVACYPQKQMGDGNAQSLCASLVAHAPPTLVVLDLSRNELTAVPPAVCDVVGLQTLDLNSNELTDLPADMKQLTNLTEINLSRNKLTAVPPVLCDMVSLQTLGLSSFLILLGLCFLLLGTLAFTISGGPGLLFGKLQTPGLCFRVRLCFG